MSTRRSRGIKNKNQSALDALIAARTAKASGLSALDTAKEEEIEDVYDEVTQAEYERLVAENREKDDDFLVDDEGLYRDEGEGDIWDDVSRDGRNKRRKTGKGSRRRRPQRKSKIEELKKIDSRFLRGGTTAALASMDGDEGDDAMLDSLLDGLDEDADDAAVEAGVDANKLTDMALFAPQSKISDPGALEVAETEMPPPQPRRGRKRRAAGADADTDEPAVEASMDAEDVDDGVAVADEDDGEEEVEEQPLSYAADDEEEELVDDVPAPDITGAAQSEPAAAQDSKASPAPRVAPAAPRKASAASVSVAAAHGAFDGVVSNSNSSLVSNGELTMYYYDAYMERFATDATVYLFGKSIIGTSAATRKSVSVCVAVQNIQRSLFIKPRKFKVKLPSDPTSVTDQPVEIKDVYFELAGILKRMGVKKFGAKAVRRKFCFEQPYVHPAEGERKAVPAVDAEGEYLKLKYSYAYPALPRNLKGKTFEFVFGTGSSRLELLLLKRELVGPCWIKVKNPVPRGASGSVSWCKHEFSLASHKNIEKMPNPQPPSPPFSMLSLSLKTVLNKRTHAHEVAVASLQFQPSINVDSPLPDDWRSDCKQISMIRKLEGRGWPIDLLRVMQRSGKKLIKQVNERALLNFLANKISALDPDIIIGHELHGFMIDVLMNRMQHHKVQFWSRIGRLKKSRFPSSSARGGLSLVDFGVGCGRLMVDTQVSAKELVRENTYTLTHLAKTRLKEYRQDVQTADVELAYGSGQSLLKMVAHTERDAGLTVDLANKLQVIPLTKQLTSICGNLWSRSLRSARAERVEHLLLHRFHKQKYIVPEKLTGREKREKMAARNGEQAAGPGGKRRKKPKYSGGLVLEPKKGFYDKYVLMLDFNSLYPSIILEFDLCFTTTRHWEPKEEGVHIDLPAREKDHRGILPNVIKQLLSRRKVVKKLMKAERNKAKREVLNIRQLAIKLVANSMYGCLGFSSSRFFCQPIAALITSQGRSILGKTKQLAENSLGMEVIYGDTDSIMIYTDSDDYEEVFRLGNKVKLQVNKLYRDLTIDIDGVYKKMLLLRKKKYAALSVTTNPDGIREAHKESKGLDLVRRDWSPISKSAGNYVLDRILSDASREEVVDKILDHLRELAGQIQADKLPLGRFVVTKGLTKHPNDYPDAKNQPHVMVAKRMLQQNRSVRVGAYIPFIICEGDKAMAQRAFHIDEVRRSNGQLKIDKKWYLSNQIFPPISRLCAPIKEIGAAQIADALGLEGKKYAMYDAQNAGDNVVLSSASSIQDDKERFKNCNPLKIPCACGVHRAFGGVYDIEAKRCGLECGTPHCKGLVSQDGARRIINAVSLASRKTITEYYDGHMQCTNPVCRRVTRTLPLGSAKCINCYEPLRQACTDAQLYTQLSYFQSLFDLKRAKKNLDVENKRREDAGMELLKIQLSAAQEDVCEGVFNYISEQLISKSGYNFINLGPLFSFNLS